MPYIAGLSRTVISEPFCPSDVCQVSGKSNGIVSSCDVTEFITNPAPQDFNAVFQGIIIAKFLVNMTQYSRHSIHQSLINHLKQKQFLEKLHTMVHCNPQLFKNIWHKIWVLHNLSSCFLWLQSLDQALQWRLPKSRHPVFLSSLAYDFAHSPNAWSSYSALYAFLESDGTHLTSILWLCLMTDFFNSNEAPLTLWSQWVDDVIHLPWVTN